HTRCYRDWSSDVCSSDLTVLFSNLDSPIADDQPEAERLHRVEQSSVPDLTAFPVYECIAVGAASVGHGNRGRHDLTNGERERDRSEERRVGKERGGRVAR